MMKISKMMKFMNCVIVLVILYEGFRSINGEALKCKFEDYNFFGSTGSLYSCLVTALENPNDNKIITGHNGVHKPNQIDTDVEQIYILKTNTIYIPANLGSVFNFNSLIIKHSQLVEIRSEDFQGMLSLEYLSFYGNKLTSVPSDAFIRLPKLSKIDLRSNQIKYISSGIFDKLTNLNTVHLQGNVCVNENYYGASGIIQVKNYIKDNCSFVKVMLDQLKNNFINEMKVMKSERQQEHNKITNEVAKASEKGQKEFKDLNEMIKTLIKASEEHQKDRDEITKLKADLSTAKEEQKKEHDENIKVTMERDQLIIELTELTNDFTSAKETIDQKLPKMEQLIEDFYMEVMDLKIERHNDRQNSITLRSKLMETKNQLAECQINERISC